MSIVQYSSTICYTLYMRERPPKGYICQFCHWLAGNESEYKQNSDIVYQNNDVTAFISPKWWKTNPGHVIVIPNQHYECLADIPDEQLHNVYKLVKKVSVALKETYGCTITSTRQHDPHGNNDVWHFHAHVFPRYEDDQLYQNHDNKRYTTPSERLPYAQKLREYFAYEAA